MVTALPLCRPEPERWAAMAWGAVRDLAGAAALRAAAKAALVGYGTRPATV